MSMAAAERDRALKLLREANAEIERLKKVADQAIERADLRLAKDSDAGYCELNQRLPVWSCFHSDLHAYLEEKEKQGCE